MDCSAQWTVKLDVTRMAVFTPATKTGGEALRRPDLDLGYDAHEEVRGEERAEEHDLRRDEEEDAEHGADARALVLAAARGARMSAACAVMRAPMGAALGRLDDDVVDGQLRLVADALDQVTAQPARAPVRVRRDDDLVHLFVADGVGRGSERIRVGDPPVGPCPRQQPRDRVAQPPASSWCAWSPELWGAMTRLDTSRRGR